MLRVNFDDGSTSSFDLESPEGLARWRAVVNDPTAQARIRGLQVAYSGHVHALPSPALGTPVTWDAELVASKGVVSREIAIAYAHPARIVLTVYRRDPAFTTVTVERFGRRVLSPPRRIAR